MEWTFAELIEWWGKDPTDWWIAAGVVMLLICVAMVLGLMNSDTDEM